MTTTRKHKCPGDCGGEVEFFDHPRSGAELVRHLPDRPCPWLRGCTIDDVKSAVEQPAQKKRKETK